MRILLFFLLCQFISLAALEHAIDAKRERAEPIKKFHICGERCSGTNYAQALICQNSNLKHIRWSHKHFPPWYSLPEEHWLGLKYIYNFNRCDNILFVIVVRDVYDWLRSLHTQPHCADKSLYNLPLTEFIRSPWILDDNDPCVISERRIFPLMDTDPETKKPFENVLKLRTAKLKTMLQLMQRAPNAYLVRYEEMNDHPKEVLRELSKLYGIEFNDEFTPINRYKGAPFWAIYQPKKYQDFMEGDISYINSQLDEDLESSLGYRLIKDRELQN